MQRIVRCQEPSSSRHPKVGAMSIDELKAALRDRGIPNAMRQVALVKRLNKAIEVEVGALRCKVPYLNVVQPS